ncbi:MAG: HD-GYP domain-containing protein [Thermodesulfobacteriota bacterium]
MSQEPGKSAKRKILIVDDEDAIRSLFEEALEELGYDCDVARNGLECLEKFQRANDFDVVLLDIQMPQLNGIETLKRLKVHFPDLSIIMVSASRDIENVRVAMKEGAYDYVFKPFNVVDVDAVVKRALERDYLIKENRDYQRNLERRVEEQTHELVRAYSGTLEAMILALDLREHETGYHSYRVTEYAVNLGKHMELTDEELSVIAKGALMHDIGKIGVPDHILLKPDKLTDEEWELMRKHAEFGYELLKKIDFLEESAKIVHTHHERYDGQGYPAGMSKDDIPLGARIFSVVDALDAMTSRRSYRQALQFEDAVQRITEASGSQFDPRVVDVFVEIPIDEWKNIKKRIADSGSEYLKQLMLELSRYKV